MIDPSYLQDARRQLSAINMKNSKSLAVQQMGLFLSRLPRISGQNEALDKALDHDISDIYKTVADTLTDKANTDSESLVPEMTLEFIFHLKEFKKEWGLLLLENIRQFKWFCDPIIKSALLVKQRNITSWKQGSTRYHIQSSTLQKFIEGILDVSDYLDVLIV